MLIYYVYAYINKCTGLPYYIGKGKEYRAYAKHAGIGVPKDKSKIVFLETNLSNVGALALERRYILWYGRKDIDPGGILLNRTEGGEGATGPKSEKHKAALSLANQGKTQSETQINKRLQTLKEIDFGGWERTKESIERQVQTARENGSYVRSKESIDKQIETQKKNGSNPMKNPETVKLQKEKRRKTMIERGIWKGQ